MRQYSANVTSVQLNQLSCARLREIVYVGAGIVHGNLRKKETRRIIKTEEKSSTGYWNTSSDDYVDGIGEGAEPE